MFSTILLSLSAVSLFFFCNNQAPYCRHILLKGEHVAGSLLLVFDLSFEQPSSIPGSPDAPTTDTLTTRAKYNLQPHVAYNYEYNYSRMMKKVEETVRAGASFLP